MRLKEISKIYGEGIRALDEVDIEIKEGEFVVILGPSGAGKSALLRCISRIIKPTRGKIFLNGREATSIRGHALLKMRQDIGMIFQQFNLVKRLSVLNNVLCGRLGVFLLCAVFFILFHGRMCN